MPFFILFSSSVFLLSPYFFFFFGGDEGGIARPVVFFLQEVLGTMLTFQVRPGAAFCVTHNCTGEGDSCFF